MTYLPYVHPVAAGLTTLLLFYVGSLGLRARNDRRRRAILLQQHERLAWPIFYLALISFAGGLFSTWQLRDDLELAASPHLRIGVALLVALSGSAITARRMAQLPMRNAHPWFGIAALLLAGAQVFFGLQMTP